MIKKDEQFAIIKECFEVVLNSKTPEELAMRLELIGSNLVKNDKIRKTKNGTSRKKHRKDEVLWRFNASRD